jgi:replicative DNA helicase
MTEIQTINDVATESIIVGMLYRKPELIDEYIELINPEYDFSEDGLKLYYKLLINTYLNTDKINETSINIALSKMSSQEQIQFKNMGGFKTFERLSVISEVSNDFTKYYEELKSYNVLRHLQSKGFSIERNLDKLKGKTVDEIIKAYEAQLLKACSFVKGVNESVRIGDKTLEIYEQLKDNPDIGIPIPFNIINNLIRGWATGKMYGLAMHSGFGKSRMIAFILAYTSIINQIPVLFCVNEQEQIEIELMILTCIANNVFGKKYGFTVNESEIAGGICSGKKDQMIKEAAQFIQTRSRIQFMELQSWDFNTLKMVLKRHKLRGINHVVIDTFKPMRGSEVKNMSEWQQFVITSEKLKSIIGSEKRGGLNLGLWLTIQLTDESLQSKILNSMSIASGKQIKHSFDYLQMSRVLDSHDKTKIKVKIDMPDNICNGQIQELDFHKTYYLTVVDKNRRGLSSQNIIFEVDKGLMTWKEIGHAVMFN